MTVKVEKLRSIAHIPIGKALKSCIAKMHRGRPNDLVFPFYGKSSGLGEAQGQFLEFLKLAKLGGPRNSRTGFRNLRLTFAQWLCRAGTPLSVCMDLLGIRDQSIRKRLSPLSLEMKRNAIDSVPKIYI